MNIKCFLFGHKIGKINDGGYDVCSRCDKHEYYDSDFSNSGIMRKIYIVIRTFALKLKAWYKFKFKNELPF